MANISELDCEEWRVVDGFEDYEVSSLGRIRRFSDKRLRKLKPSKLGYIRVDLYKNREPHWFCVHRLVAAAFLENKNKLPQVNHKNGVKGDNRVVNLEWCSRSDNIIHAYKNNLRKPPRETPVRCVETRKEYCNLHEAVRNVGGNVSNLWKHLHNEKNHGRFAKMHWEYIGE